MSIFILRATTIVEPPEPTDIVRDGLILEWRFDDGSGQVLTDYSGNDLHGQLGSGTGSDTNDPAWVSPRGLAFTSNDYVRLASLPTLNPPFSAQVVSRRTGSVARMTRLHLRNGTSTRIILQSEASTDAFRLYDALASPMDNQSAGAVGDGRVSMTVTVPSGAGTALGYLGNTQVVSYTAGSTYGINNLFLGASHGTSEFLSGQILSVVLYTGILTPEQIAQNNAHYQALGIL